MIIRLAHPLISCICITYNRPQMLLKTIVSFDAQNYPNRELVISYPKNDIITKELVKNVTELSALNIIPVEREADESLGLARNNAIAQCNGEYICSWDDDDIYHYNRITHQFNSMQGNYYQAGILSRILIYDAITHQAYFSPTHLWGGTLICKTDLLKKHPYTEINITEESYLLNKLDANGQLFKIADAPFLYTAVRHQNNRLDRFYFQKFLNEEYQMGEASSKNLQEQYEIQINLQQ